MVVSDVEAAMPVVEVALASIVVSVVEVVVWAVGVALVVDEGVVEIEEETIKEAEVDAAVESVVVVVSRVDVNDPEEVGSELNI